jgi:hypothetical protein
MHKIIYPLKLQFFQSLTCNSFIFALIFKPILLSKESDYEEDSDGGPAKSVPIN